MRRGIPRVPAAAAATAAAAAAPACPPPAPGLPLVLVLLLLALATPLLYTFFSRAPPLLALVPLLRPSPAAAAGGPEDLHATLSALAAYRAAQAQSLAAKRRSFKHLQGRQRALARALGYPARQERLREAGEANAAFLEGLAGLGRRELGPHGRSWARGKGGRGDQGRVHEMCKHFVRDWSAEGQRERDALFTPILDKLDGLFPADGTAAHDRSALRVLVPGAGLSRLAYEISARGFVVDANDYSWFMHLASTLILSHTAAPNEHTLHPYIHSLSHHRSPEGLLRGVTFPDVVPEKTALNLVRGDFLTLFEEEGTHDAVVTLFFIDTAHNILDYLDQIWRSLKPGGWWINEGPLLWFGTPRLELTLAEVLDAARQTGFVLHEHRAVDSDYTGNTDGLFRYIYEAQFWAMQKPPTAPGDDDGDGGGGGGGGGGAGGDEL